MKTKIFAILSLLIVIPNISYALASDLNLTSLVSLSNTLASGVVTSLGYLAFTVAVVAFLWGMVNFVWAARNGDAGKGVENGKQFMLWGLISLFVMFSVWGIIKFTQGVFNIQGQTNIIIPNIQLLGSTSASPAGSGGITGSVACNPPNVLNSYGQCVNPTTGAPAPVTGTTGNTAYDACITAGGGVTECRVQTTCPSGTACTKNNAQGNQINGKCDTNSKCTIKDQPCMATVCSNTNNPPSCNNVTGSYDATDNCVVSGGAGRGSVNPPQILAFGNACEPEAASFNASGQGQNIPLCGAGLSCPYDDIVCKISDGLACQNDNDCSVFHSKCLAGRSGAKICTPIN